MLRWTLDRGAIRSDWSRVASSDPFELQSDTMTEAGVAAGLATTSVSAYPTRPSAPANHQSMAGASQRTPDSWRSRPVGFSVTWSAAIVAATDPVAASAIV